MTNVNKYIDEFCTGREFMCELLSSASIRDSDLTSDPDWTYYRQHYPHQQHIVVRHIHDSYEREYTLLSHTKRVSYAEQSLSQPLLLP